MTLLLFAGSQEVSMLGRVDAQGSLLSTALVHDERLTKNSFYERLALHGHEIVTDEDFAHLYSRKSGRPSHPPSLMAKALLLATHDKTSDRESARRSRVDLDWRAALGVDDDFAGIGATTFSLFRARIVLEEDDQHLFESTLRRAVEAGVLRGKLTAIIDSSPVHGAGAVADTYELVRGFLGKVVVACGERLSQHARDAASPHIGEKPDIDWQDKATRQAYLGELVSATRAVLGEASAIDDADLAEVVALLSQVIDQDIEDGEDGVVKIKEGVAPDRVISVADPEMRHGRKSASRRFNGHKLDVMSDEATELVLGVAVRAGNASDAAGTLPLLEQVQRLEGTNVAVLLGDMAYSDPDLREATEKAGTDLVAKVPPVSNAGRFPKTDFSIDTAEGTVTCPAGVVTTDSRPERDARGRPGRRFSFADATCATCPLRASCVKGETKGRTIFVSRHEDRVAKARVAQREPETKALLRRRSKVERKIAHLQHLGMRTARYSGRRKTTLQALLAATVANFSRLAVLGVFDTTTAIARVA
jgi:hypothetical protein